MILLSSAVVDLISAPDCAVVPVTIGVALQHDSVWWVVWIEIDPCIQNVPAVYGDRLFRGLVCVVLDESGTGLLAIHSSAVRRDVFFNQEGPIPTLLATRIKRVINPDGTTWFPGINAFAKFCFPIFTFSLESINDRTPHGL